MPVTDTLSVSSFLVYIVYYSVECIYNRPDVPPAVKALFVAIFVCIVMSRKF